MTLGNASPALTAVAVALVLLGCLTTCVECKDTVDKLQNLRTYIQDLEYIEDEEQLQGLSAKDTDTVEGAVIIQTCDLMIKDEIKVEGDDFLDLVKADLANWDECLRKWTAKVSKAEWKFETDITDENEQYLSNMALNMSNWDKGLARNAEQYLKHPKYSTLNTDLKRQIRLLAFNTDPKNEDDAKDLIAVQNKLQKTYSQAQVSGLNLEPELTEIMAECTNNSEMLLEAWCGWRDATGPYMRENYTEMVRLLNKGAQEHSKGAGEHNFTDFAEAWMASQFDQTDNLEEIAEQLWEEIRPLYEQLHAYIRTKLSQTYPEYNYIFQKGGIPAHLSGNMWAQNWENIYKLVKPYPWIEEPDYDEEMVAQEYTVDKMFEMAEDFYISIGLSPMSTQFKELSMKVRPENKEVVCHASAHDFLSKKPEQDFRIKMCTEINMDSLETIHHEMGHIEYFMEYQDQPAIYRTGANSAFHEAIGDTISLSVRSKDHLKRIGLAGKDDDSGSSKKRFSKLLRGLEEEMHDINFLLHRALSKIMFLPFGYMVDKWRWGVFRGNITEENFNKNWWDLRLKYQGLVAPVQRSEADFDPGAKYHIPSNSPYICYFISFIVQFQFYEAMCEASEHKGQLHLCDFYGSKAAGNKLKDMLKLGMSKPWPEAMEKLTGPGNKVISTDAILKYFKPLRVWLEQQNAKFNTTVGWENAEINWKTED